MSKWADYVITHVRFKKSDSVIETVKLWEHTGDRLINREAVSREKVISLLDKDKSIVTAYKDNGKWKKGETVHTVVVDDITYIRTDKNNKPEDNHGNLPEF